MSDGTMVCEWWVMMWWCVSVEWWVMVCEWWYVSDTSTCRGGTSDPYVRVMQVRGTNIKWLWLLCVPQGQEEMHRTPEKKKTVEPVWNDQSNIYTDTAFIPLTFQVNIVYIYISVYLYICISVYLNICISVDVYICMSVYMYIYISVCLYICISVYLYICICIYLYVCISVFLCICISVFLLKYC